MTKKPISAAEVAARRYTELAFQSSEGYRKALTVYARVSEPERALIDHHLAYAGVMELARLRTDQNRTHELLEELLDVLSDLVQRAGVLKEGSAFDSEDHDDEDQSQEYDEAQDAPELALDTSDESAPWPDIEHGEE